MRLMLSLAAAAVIWLAGSLVCFSQTTFVWGSNGSGTPAGGSGTWDTLTANWQAASSTTYQAWPVGTSGENDRAYFGGPGGTVSIGDTIYTAGITFAADGYTLTGGTGTLILDNATGFAPSITVANAGQTATIGSPISGTQGILFNGHGTLVLNGSNGFTNGIDMTSSTLELMTATGSLDSTNTLYMGTGDEQGDAEGGGGTFIVDNTGATRATSQTLSSLYAYAGDSLIQTNDIAAQSLTLNLGSQTRVKGATINYATNGGVNGSTNEITLSSRSAGFIDQGTFFDGSNFAWCDSGGFVRGIDYGVDPGSITSGGASSIASTSYVQTTGAVTAESTATFTTLDINGGTNFTVGSGNTLTLSGLLKSGGGSSSLTGGTLKIGSSKELVIRADQTADSLMIGATIINPTSGAGAVTETGQGTVYITATNSYTGGTYINGTVSVATLPSGSGASTLGTGAVSISGGDLIYTGTSLTTTRSFSIMAGGGEINVAVAGTTLTLNSGVPGANSGLAADSLIKGGPGTLTLSGGSDNSGLEVEVNAGTLILGKTSTSVKHSVSALIVNNGGTAQLAGSGGDQIYDYGLGVTVNAGGVLDFNGRTEAFDSLAGGGTITNTSATAGGVMEIGVNNDAYGTPTFSGVISDGAANNMSLIKYGSGTQVLGGSNTYSGPTTINAGILAVTGSGSVASSSALTIASGAEFSSGTCPYQTGANQVVTVSGTFAGSPSVSGTLTGTGLVTGTTTVNPGGILLPGSSPGVLFTGGLNLESGGAIKMEIAGTTAGTGYDELVVSGAISLSGSLQISLLNLGNGFTFQVGQKFFILDDTDNTPGNGVTGTFSNAPNNLITSGTNTFRVNYADNADGAAGAANPNDVSLTVVATPAPEPGTQATLVAGMAMLLGVQRLRRKALR